MIEHNAVTLHTMPVLNVLQITLDKYIMILDVPRNTANSKHRANCTIVFQNPGRTKGR